MSTRRWTFRLETARGETLLEPPLLYSTPEARDIAAGIARNSVSILKGVRARVRKIETEWERDR